MQLRKEFRRLVEAKELFVLPGAYDALSAKIIEAAGFKGAYMTGYGQAASHLGVPDVGLIGMSEMAERVANITAAVNIPVLCDGDTGFGNMVNMVRTVREYERSGAAAIQIEDQVLPKKCGHMLGRQLISTEDMVVKIKAAVAARTDEDFLIVARTDARTNFGIDEAIKRANAYVEAGADIIFLESAETTDEMIRLNKEIQAPTLANMVEGGRTPFLTVKELEEIGYDAVIFPVSSLYAAARAVADSMRVLYENGTTKPCLDKMVDFGYFNNLIGLPKIRAIEAGDLSVVEKKFAP